MEDKDKMLEKLARSTHSPRGKFSAEESWGALEKCLAQSKSSQQEQHGKIVPMRRLWLRKLATVAAAAIFCIAACTTYLYLKPAEMLTISTLAEIQTVTLPDGSAVTLNRYSSLMYPERFKRKNREVKLIGGAYFEVAKDKSHPFIVQTEAVNVQVIGTHFNMEAYQRDAEVRTTLLEGSVAVSDKVGSSRIVLQPNECAIYDKKGGIMRHEMLADASSAIGWSGDALVFDNLPMREILRQLSHAFNVEMQLDDDTLGNYRLTARFELSDGLGTILQLLSQAGKFEYRQKNGVIIIASLKAQ